MGANLSAAVPCRNSTRSRPVHRRTFRSLAARFTPASIMHPRHYETGCIPERVITSYWAKAFGVTNLRSGSLTRRGSARSSPRFVLSTLIRCFHSVRCFPRLLTDYYSSLSRPPSIGRGCSDGMEFSLYGPPSAPVVFSSLGHYLKDLPSSHAASCLLNFVFSQFVVTQIYTSQ